MKKLFTFLLLFSFAFTYAQAIKPSYKEVDNKVQATYYYKDGSIKERGFFKNKKLTGEWVSYNEQGGKMMIAYYNNGKKVGKWYAINGSTIKEISYNNNTIVGVKKIKEEAALAYN